MSLNIRKISLILSGKIYPYNKFSRLEFMENLETIFGYSLGKIDFYWKQANKFEEDFYFLVIEYLYKKSKKNKLEKEKFEKLLEKIGIKFNNIDIRKISMFLAGKLPPYYGNSNLYSFTKALRKFAKEEYTNNEMMFIQQQAKGVDEEIYFMVLDDIKNNKKLLSEIIKYMNIPKEVINNN